MSAAVRELDDYRTTRFERIPPRSISTQPVSTQPTSGQPTPSRPSSSRPAPPRLTSFGPASPDSPSSDWTDPSGVRDTLIDDEDPMDALVALAEQRVGRAIGDRYELRRLLGTGSAGAVYAAIDRDVGRTVAVKVLHEGLQTSDEHVARFVREARAASAIGHSSVVTIFDVGKDLDGTLFMVLELLAGESLFYAIRDASLSTADIVEIGRQLLDGLAAAHAHRIIHRDVKPENIFLTKERTGSLRVKLFDFGIAKCLRPDLGNSFATMDGLIMGTPHYMSPEMCIGETASPSADLWATAAVMYHAFAGTPPFDDRHIGRLLLKIVRERVPSLATHRPDLPPSLIEAIDRALDPDRTKRWPTAHDFARALGAASAPIEGLTWDDMD